MPGAERERPARADRIGGQADLWQVADGFRFRMAGGRIQTSPPSKFLHPAAIEQVSVGLPLPAQNGVALLRNYIRVEARDERDRRPARSVDLGAAARPDREAARRSAVSSSTGVAGTAAAAGCSGSRS